jgi:hypothetical protein
MNKYLHARLEAVRSLMSAEMHAELADLAMKEPGVLAVEKVRLDRAGFVATAKHLPVGKYIGALASGERVHRIDTEYGALYVRSRATATQLRAAFLHGRSK